MNFKVAIVEDDLDAIQIFCTLVRKYSATHEDKFIVSSFQDPYDFLESQISGYDCCFLDIQMPVVNGLTVAQQIRKEHETLPLVFITSLSHYAIRGYEVNAFDFIVKPLSEQGFFFKLDRICKLMRSFHDDHIVLSNKGESHRLKVKDIYYVEVRNHDLTFHMVDGLVTVRGALKRLETDLNAYGFARSSGSFLINLRHVTNVQSESVCAGGENLPLSRSMRTQFLAAYARFIGGSR